MIARIIRGRSFKGLLSYLTSEKKGLTADHVDARHIVDIGRAAAEMRAVASLSKRCEKPVYHVILAWAPDEMPTLQQQKDTAAALLERIGLGGNQAVIVVHDEAKDGIVPGMDGRHHETHICVNRVSFEGKAIKLAHDFALVEKAAAEIAADMDFRLVPGRFNGLDEALAQPGLGLAATTSASVGKTIADEIRDDPRRLAALRAARRKGWEVLIGEFRRQGILLVRGPAQRRPDLARGIVMVDMQDPRRKLKISSLDSPDEKWGAGALARELGPQPDTLGEEPAANMGGLSAPTTPSPLYRQFQSEREAAFARRKAARENYAKKLTALIEAQRAERTRLYQNACRRRRILRNVFGPRSIARTLLNHFFDVIVDQRNVEIKARYGKLWTELRTRKAKEEVDIPRWASWRRSHVHAETIRAAQEEAHAAATLAATVGLGEAIWPGEDGLSMGR